MDVAQKQPCIIIVWHAFYYRVKLNPRSSTEIIFSIFIDSAQKQFWKLHRGMFNKILYTQNVYTKNGIKVIVSKKASIDFQCQIHEEHTSNLNSHDSTDKYADRNMMILQIPVLGVL